MRTNKTQYNEQRRGQVMILAALVIGGTILSATSIAGLLTVYQLRAATDVSRSAKAIFAADAGIEWGLYEFFRGTNATAPTFTNNATVVMNCYNANDDPTLTTPIPCTTPTTTVIRAVGTGNNTANRAFEMRLQ
jgi:hypothetical protein